MKVRVIASLVTVLCLAVGSANASSIAAYFAADGSDCDQSVSAPFTNVNVWILARLYTDEATGGITGAEFRLDGWPAAWFGTPAPNPAANVINGNPIAGGTNIAFPVCQLADSHGFVLLFTLPGLATTVPEPLDLIVLRHTTPSNQNFQCPLLVLCDQPTYTKVCVAGGEAFINGSNCSVAVQPSTWSKVKSLYN